MSEHPGEGRGPFVLETGNKLVDFALCRLVLTPHFGPGSLAGGIGGYQATVGNAKQTLANL